jgi:DNA-binding IclR family transcriptional regulator
MTAMTSAPGAEPVHDSTPEAPPESLPTGRVQSVDRALRLLAQVGAAPAGVSLAELARLCGINRATAWRLLATLEDHGLIDRDPADNRYRVGFAMIRMSRTAGYDGLVRRVRPLLERVSAQTGETAALAVAGQQGVMYIGEVRPVSVLTVSWLAREVPLHATSTGKAFLATLPEPEALGLLKLPLEGFTDTTLTSRDRLLTELRRIRKRGYAECAGELEPTLFGVSAPVLDSRDGRPVVIFSIWGPVNRITPERFPALGDVAVQAATEVGGLLAVDAS